MNKHGRRRGGSAIADGFATFGRAASVFYLISGIFGGVVCIAFGIGIMVLALNPNMVLAKLKAPNPTPDTKKGPDSSLWVGVGISVFGIAMIVASYMWFKYVQRNQNMATLSGVDAGFGALKLAF